MREHGLASLYFETVSKPSILQDLAMTDAFQSEKASTCQEFTPHRLALCHVASRLTFAQRNMCMMHSICKARFLWTIVNREKDCPTSSPLIVQNGLQVLQVMMELEQRRSGNPSSRSFTCVLETQHELTEYIHETCLLLVSGCLRP